MIEFTFFRNVSKSKIIYGLFAIISVRRVKIQFPLTKRTGCYRANFKVDGPGSKRTVPTTEWSVMY